MNEKYVEISFQLISVGGDAKAMAFESIELAKNGEFDLAEKKLQESKNKLTDAHKCHFELIQDEAKGNKAELSILLIHAQDHLMSAITIIELADTVIELYKRTATTKEDLK